LSCHYCHADVRHIDSFLADFADASLLRQRSFSLPYFFDFHFDASPLVYAIAGFGFAAPLSCRILRHSALLMPLMPLIFAAIDFRFYFLSYRSTLADAADCCFGCHFRHFLHLAASSVSRFRFANAAADAVFWLPYTLSH